LEKNTHRTGQAYAPQDAQQNFRLDEFSPFLENTLCARDILFTDRVLYKRRENTNRKNKSDQK
jgi:hypothetical protein